MKLMEDIILDDGVIVIEGPLHYKAPHILMSASDSGHESISIIMSLTEAEKVATTIIAMIETLTKGEDPRVIPSHRSSRLPAGRRHRRRTALRDGAGDGVG